MVKNTTGGNKSKGFARKNFTKKDNSLRTSEDAAEVYTQVTKIYGGPMCQVVTVDGTELLCHIRGKFRGRGKRDNFICNGTWLLVGLREWEKEPAPGKLLNCDVIEVYSDNDKTKLKSNITNVNWEKFIINDNTKFGIIENSVDSEILFADDRNTEYDELIKAQIESGKAGKSTIINTDDGELVDIDDI
jgi:hypothetical protein